MKHYCAISLLGLLLPTMLACSSGSYLSNVAGAVSVDGKPVDSGTIHFQSNSSAKASGGAAISNGSFTLSDANQLPPGEYAVVVQAYRKTGRVFNDPQKGKVEVTEPMPLVDSPQTVQLSAENARSLSLDFHSATK